MSAPRIAPFVHRCVVTEGDMAGNKFSLEVEPWKFEQRMVCPNCGEEPATERELIAHIYQELLE